MINKEQIKLYKSKLWIIKNKMSFLTVHIHNYSHLEKKKRLSIYGSLTYQIDSIKQKVEKWDEII